VVQRHNTESSSAIDATGTALISSRSIAVRTRCFRPHTARGGSATITGNGQPRGPTKMPPDEHRRLAATINFYAQQRRT
jgi:hypothetical protein